MKLAAKIGVFQIEGPCVRLAVVKTGGNRPAIVERTVREAPQQEGGEARAFLVQTIGEAVEDLHARPQVFVLCADGQYGVVRTLTIPFRGAGKVAAAVQFELEPYLAFPIEDLVVDHETLRERSGNTDVLVAGMRRDRLADCLALFEEAGVSIEGIGVDAAGLTAAWLATRTAGQDLRAVVHFRERDAVLTIVEGRKLLFFRYLALTPETIAEDAGRAAREIANSLRAFLGVWETEKPLSAIHTTGGGLGPALHDALEAALDIPVEEDDLAQALRGRGASKQRRRPRRSGEAASARIEEDGAQNVWEAMAGVAVGAAGASPSFNFLKGELAPPHVWRPVLMHAVFSAVLLAVLLGGYGAYVYMTYRSNVAQRGEMEAQIRDLYAEAFPGAGGPPPVDPSGDVTLQLMRDAKEAMEEEGAGFNPELLGRPSLLDILNELSTLLDPDKIELMELEVRASNGLAQSVIIKGELKDPVTGAQELSKLRGSRILTLRDEPVIATQDNETTFSISAMTNRAVQEAGDGS